MIYAVYLNKFNRIEFERWKQLWSHNLKERLSDVQNIQEARLLVCTRYLIYIIYTHRRRERNTLDFWFGLVWFDLCICSCSCSVGGRFTISSSLSFVLTLHAIVLAFEWNFVETAFVNNITTITILFNCATAIVCEMQSDLVSAEKIWAVKCNCLQPAMTFTRCSWWWRFWGEEREKKAVWWKPAIAIVITVRNIRSTTTSTSSSNNTSWHQ